MYVGNSCLHESPSWRDEILARVVSVTFPLSDVQINRGRLERQGTRKECGQGDCWTNKSFGLMSCVRRKKSRCSQHKEILPAVEWDTT